MLQVCLFVAIGWRTTTCHHEHARASETNTVASSVANSNAAYQPLLNSDWEVLQQNVVVVAASIPVVVVGVGTAVSSRWGAADAVTEALSSSRSFGSSLHQWQSLTCNKINFPNAPSLQRILDLFRFLCDWSTTSTPANEIRYIFSAGFQIIFPWRTTYRAKERKTFTNLYRFQPLLDLCINGREINVVIKIDIIIGLVCRCLLYSNIFLMPPARSVLLLLPSF